MADTTLPGVLLKGVAASRPAASAVAKGTIYSATDTGAITQSDGSSWSTFATISSGLADPMTTRGDIIIRNSSNTTARLAIGSSGKVLSSDGTDVSWQTPAGATAASGARVYNSSNIALNNGSATLLTFNTERYDDASYHDTGSNTGRLTVPSAGRYLVGGHVQMSPGVGDPAYIYIRLNGTTTLAVSSPGATTNEAAYISITTMWDCTGGTEYFELYCFASAGSKNAVAASAFSPEFWIERMGDT